MKLEYVFSCPAKLNDFLSDRLYYLLNSRLVESTDSEKENERFFSTLTIQDIKEWFKKDLYQFVLYYYDKIPIKKNGKISFKYEIKRFRFDKFSKNELSTIEDFCRDRNISLKSEERNLA
jgi:hypothetical protein